jgi:hypothetical protein
MFISSTMDDLKEERKKIEEIVTESGNRPILAERIFDVENTPRKVIEKRVDECDCYIGILHEKWGHVPISDNPEKLSITAIEYRRAKTNGVPVLILISNHMKEPELEQFIDKISNIDTGVWRKKYENSNDLFLKVAQGITALERAVNARKSSSGDVNYKQEILGTAESPMIYGDPKILEFHSNLLLCKLYRQVRGIISTEIDALEIFGSLGLDALTDRKQATEEIVQNLIFKGRLRRDESKKGCIVKLTRDGLDWCINNCMKPEIRTNLGY